MDDWDEVYPGTPGEAVLPLITTQAARCMDCGVPFCHNGCPLGNLIRNGMTSSGVVEWQVALDRLHATNNFPSSPDGCARRVRDRLCGGIHRDPVTIKNVEVATVDKGWDDLRVTPQMPNWHTLKTVAVWIGALRTGRGPATDPGRHSVVVYERATRPAACCATASPISSSRSRLWTGA
ncbi:hypothetical protein FAM22021_001106 [Propionibacterium freudenreichii]|nr:hypothetical protein [Propionibacterium freudenreichii]